MLELLRQGRNGKGGSFTASLSLFLPSDGHLGIQEKERLHEVAHPREHQKRNKKEIWAFAFTMDLVHAARSCTLKFQDSDTAARCKTCKSM